MHMMFSLVGSLNLCDSLKCHEVTCSLFTTIAEALPKELNNCACKAVAKATNIKYLGLDIEENLSWKIHVQTLKGKLRSYIRLFYQLKEVCPKSTLRQIYFGIINSRIQYGIAFWGGCNATCFDDVAKLQKHFVRILSGVSRRSRSYPLFIQHRILPLKHLYVYKVLDIYYKRSGDKKLKAGHESSHDLIQTRGRKNNNLCVPKPTTARFQRSYVYLGPKLRNKLPSEAKDSQTIYQYRSKVKKWLGNLKIEDVEKLCTKL